VHIKEVGGCEEFHVLVPHEPETSPHTQQQGSSTGGPRADHGGSSRDLLQKIQLIASQIAFDAERAQHMIAPNTNNNTSDPQFLAGNLSTILGTLTDAHSALSNHYKNIHIRISGRHAVASTSLHLS